MPGWSPAAALGRLASRRRETEWSKPEAAFAGVLTARGFQSVVRQRLDDAARDAIGEEWVRGSSNPAETSVDQIAQAALQLYVSDFELQWRSLLGDLRVKTPQTIADAAEVTRLLSTDPSPVEAITRSIVAATDLRSPDALVTGSISTKIKRAPECGCVIQLAGSLCQASGSARCTSCLPRASNGFRIRGAAATSPSEATGVHTSEIAGSIVARFHLDSNTGQGFDVDGQLTTANQDLLQQARQMPAPLDAGWQAWLRISDLSPFGLPARELQICGPAKRPVIAQAPLPTVILSTEAQQRMLP